MQLQGLGGHWPDYQDGSIVNLMSRIGERFGRKARTHGPCAALGASTLEDYEQVILLVIDGLGYDYVLQQPGMLRSACQASLSSVFPSTTATSVTGFLTGEAPQQHGLTGWFTYLAEVDAVTAVLPCTLRGSKTRLAELGVNIGRLYSHPIFFDELNCPSHLISQNWILSTDFNSVHTGRASTHGYETLEEMSEQIVQCVKRASSDQFIYAYWSEFDYLSHVHGNHSETVTQHYRQLQSAVAGIMQQLKGTRSVLLISADHGFIDTSPQQCITVNNHPELQQCLSMPLSGEPRAAYCYVKPGCHETFVNYLHEHFSEQLQCVASHDLLARHVFGLGEAHPALASRIGDYTLIMKENFIIKDWMASENHFFHTGVHGGVSFQEMYVPLIMLPAN